MPQAVHGGLNIAELRSLGLRPDDVLDFSASINPLGVVPGVKRAMQGVNLAAYPDTDCTELREALSVRLGIAAECILVGNGSTELIHLTARACLAPDETAIIFTPTFGEYEAACGVQGAQVVRIEADETAAFMWDIPSAADLIAKHKPSMVFLCNPNNPSGRYLGAGEVRRITDALPDNGLLLLDEAYLPFVEQAWDSLPLLDIGNVVLLRSMTKDYALTALRLGYMLAPMDVIQRIRRQQHSWSVNGLAQAAGVASLADDAHIRRARDIVQTAKCYIMRKLDALNLEGVPSDANFVLVRVGNAAEVRRTLLTQHKICVRDCASFGLPEYIRVAVRTPHECERLMRALQAAVMG